MVEASFACVFAGTGDTVAVMIPEAYGKDILAHLDRNLTVLVSVVFKTTKNNRGSLVFVSISFIVLMIISSAWLIFYFIQKIRYSGSHDRSQVTTSTVTTQPLFAAAVSPTFTTSTFKKALQMCQEWHCCN